MHYFFVFLGSGMGGVSRYFLSVLCSHFDMQPWMATLLCNLLGSFIISFILGMVLSFDHDLKSLYCLIIIGFLGGFTTFSSFALDSIKLYQSNMAMMCFYIICSMFGALMLCGFGVYLGKIAFRGL